MDRILVTGTGRCGTTFLTKIFTRLDFDTGFDKTKLNLHISKNCNGGLEKRKDYRKYYITKSPDFLCDLGFIVKDTTVNIKYVVFPIRNYSESAKSRERCNKVAGTNGEGGFWCATNEKEQIEFYYKAIANYIYLTTQHDIKTIFLDFDKMVSDEKYLFDKLKVILDEKNVEFELFSKIYKQATITSAPTKQ